MIENKICIRFLLKESCNFLCIKSVLQRLPVSGPACKEMASSHSHLQKTKAELKINYFQIPKFVRELRSWGKLLLPKIGKRGDAEIHKLPEQKPPLVPIPG